MGAAYTAMDPETGGVDKIVPLGSCLPHAS